MARHAHRCGCGGGGVAGRRAGPYICTYTCTCLYNGLINIQCIQLTCGCFVAGFLGSHSAKPIFSVFFPLLWIVSRMWPLSGSVQSLCVCGRILRFVIDIPVEIVFTWFENQLKLGATPCMEQSPMIADIFMKKIVLKQHVRLPE